jgi:ABC-type dipeptide/oligopeptide/nickel transport system permease component
VNAVFGPFGSVTISNCERTLSDVYRRPFADLMLDATARSLVLLVGAAVLALVLGALIGIALALLRRRAFASGGIIGLLALMAAIPSFFLAYFLQILVIVLGASEEGGRLLPVFGFGYDEHIILPLVSIAVPAIAYTAQLTATRMQDVLDAEFVTTANAKGLLQSRIIFVHVLPHVRPVLLEALGSGLRVSVASLPIIEFLFSWNGIGALALQAIGVRDAPAFVFTAVVLVAVFAVLGAIADLSRPRALYRLA